MTAGTPAALVAAAILVARAATPAADVIDRVLALVSGRPVTLSDAHAALAMGLVEAPAGEDVVAAVLPALVDRRLVLVEVDRYAVPPPDAEALARRVETLRAVVAARGGDQPLAALGLSDARIEAAASDDLRIASYYDQRFGVVEPSDEEVQAYYRAHAEEFTRGGVQLPFVEVEAIVRQRLASQRRQWLIDEWLAGLRRRSDVTVLYRPSGGQPPAASAPAVI